MARPRDDRQPDLFRPVLERIIDMGHPLVRLAGKIDWGFLDRRLGEIYAPGDGQPPLPVRLVAGLFILTKRSAPAGSRTPTFSISAASMCSGTSCPSTARR